MLTGVVRGEQHGVFSAVSDRRCGAYSNAAARIQINTPPSTNNVCVPEASADSLYTTPLQGATHGTGLRPTLGRPPVNVYFNSAKVLTYTFNPANVKSLG